MKIKILIAFLAFIIGSSWSFFLSKSFSKQIDQSIINSKLIVLDEVLNALKNKINDAGPEQIKSTFSVICELLPDIEQEAIKSGKPVSELIDPVAYSKSLKSKYKELAELTGTKGCDIK